MKKRILSIVLAMCMLFTASLTAFARETDFFEENLTPVPLEEQTWEKADRTEFDRIYADIEKALDTKADAETVIKLCVEIEDCFSSMHTSMTFCELDYYRDPEAVADAYTEWTALIRVVNNEAIELLQKVIKGGYEDAYREEFGDEYCDDILGVVTDTPEQLALLDRETELINEYNIASGSAESVEELNEVATPILIELIEIRNEYALSKGYKDYASLAYDMIYGRDYTPEDAKKFHAAVKEYILPVELELIGMLYSNPELSMEVVTLNDLSEEEQIAIVEPWMDDISDEYLNVYNYMKEYKLYDLEELETKIDAGFTIDLYEYNSAYIFNSPGQDYYDVVTLIHEFGHFANSVLSGEGASSCYDISEIHSQGLEMLYMPYADTMAGEEGDSYRIMEVLQMLGAVTDGAMYDEFQQEIYAMDDLTPEKVNSAYKEISEEYGYTYGSDEDAYRWVLVNHTFDSPYYYISYATSALGALEILNLSSDDFEKGADVYLALVAQQNVDGYVAAVEKAGLSNAFVEANIKKIAQDVLEYTYVEICDITFLEEIKGHWAEEWLLEAGMTGLLKGDEGGNVNPDDNLTAAEAITVFWRLVGSPEGWGEMDFTDVTEDRWYYEAVNWFVGYMQMNENYENVNYSGYFGANDKINRATFVWMLHLLMGEEKAEGNYLKDFPDGDSVPAPCRNAMNWAIENGIINGRDDQTLDPSGYLTRAELAKILLA